MTIFYGSAHALTAFFHGGVRQTNDGKRGKAGAGIEIDLYIHDMTVEADSGTGMNGGEHEDSRYKQSE